MEPTPGSKGAAHNASIVTSVTTNAPATSHDMRVVAEGMDVYLVCDTCHVSLVDAIRVWYGGTTPEQIQQAADQHSQDG